MLKIVPIWYFRFWQVPYFWPYFVEKGKNVQVSEDEIKVAIGALYPFQYEIVRHPIKAVGQFLINVDDYITEVFSPKKGFTESYRYFFVIKFM